MKNWKYLVLVLVAIGVIVIMGIHRVNRLGREDMVYELLTEVSAFAANHGGRLPNDWKEFSVYTNPGKNNPWSSKWLESFGQLRWGQALGGKAPHEPYLKIIDPRYKVFQAEANEYFNKYDHG